MNFRKISERGGGVIFDLKNFIAIFLHLKQLFLSWISRKTSKKGGGGHFRSEKFHCKFSAGATGLRKKLQWNFPKKGRGGGGAKAVRKFSGNSSTGFPYSAMVQLNKNNWKTNNNMVQIDDWQENRWPFHRCCLKCSILKSLWHSSHGVIRPKLYSADWWWQ